MGAKKADGIWQGGKERESIPNAGLRPFTDAGHWLLVESVHWRAMLDGDSEFIEIKLCLPPGSS